MSFCSVAGPWNVAGNFAKTLDTTGYNSEALLFINKKGDVSIGFTFYDPDCDGYEAKLKRLPVHLFNGEPIHFKSQCIAEDKIAYIPTYANEGWSIMRQFRQGEEMVFSALAKRYVYKYNAVGFGEAYDDIFEKSLKYKEDI
ncbi:hypothetical protein SHOU24_06 [Vibrio phage SHOU24]|uniref:hypothetical protein n=1 Tax=Vibrio phage SHOU24 TaxID=1414739 RepID=UPI0003ED215A|nr:hypothetical protein SHOU24_06 [Vibrio phage SHOU24]AHI61203.1 hypothetical protein SHOU24_06 [Vibrio phage SHOU24]